MTPEMSPGKSPDFDQMTPEEIAAWARRNWEEGVEAAKAEGRQVPRISRVKKEDYPHLEQTGWVFRLFPGRPAWTRVAGTERWAAGTVRGLRAVADGGPHAVLLETSPDEVWALRRADGEPWSRERDARTARVADRTVAVMAWQVSPEAVGDPSATVTAPVEPAQWEATTVEEAVIP